MANAFFTEGLRTIERWGLSDVILPFFLIFTIVFAVLQKTKILGKESRGFNTIVSLVLGLSTVIPHVLNIYPAEADVVNIINTALPNVSVVIIAVILVILIVGLFAGGEMTGYTSGGIVVAAFIIVIYIFGASAGWWQMAGWLDFLSDPDTQAVIIVLLVFAIVIWFITREKESSGEKMMTGWKDLFKKP